MPFGNAEYRHARVLPNHRNDAEAIAGLLPQIGFAAGDVTLKLDLDYKALREVVRGRAAAPHRLRRPQGQARRLLGSGEPQRRQGVLLAEGLGPDRSADIRRLCGKQAC